MPVSAARQAPAVWLCVSTTLLFRPNAGLNDPLKPAVAQAARAFATVEPTRFGTIWQPGSDVGGGGAGGCVGAGVRNGGGVGLGAVVGFGVDVGGGAVDAGGAVGWGGLAAAVGLTVGRGVVEGPPTRGREVAVARGPLPTGPSGDELRDGGVVLPSPPGGVTFGAGDGGVVRSSPTPAVSTGGDSAGPAAMSGRSETVGDPRALSTPPVGPKEDPTTSVTARTATATAAALTAISLRGSRRCWYVTRPSGRAIGPGATLIPHPGHAPVAPAQQRSHAKTPQDRHIRSPTRRSVEAAPTRFPQRSQYGSGAPPDGGDDFGTRMTDRVAGLDVGDGPLGTPGIRNVGPVASGGRGPGATGRTAEGSRSRLDTTVVGQAPGAGGATEPGGAPPMGRICRKHTELSDAAPADLASAL